jgi:glycosyltransferase involved in cell wall biosynthesis
MVGDGELLATCKDFAYTNNLRVSFPGWKAEISNYLEASNILLMTSVNEGFGLVIAEAGFFSVPAVSTDVGGIREFIDDGKNGFIVEPTEFHIASKITELIGEPDLLIRAGEEARKTTSKNFTAEIFVEKHRVAYKHLISPPPKSKY